MRVFICTHTHIPTLTHTSVYVLHELFRLMYSKEPVVKEIHQLFFSYFLMNSLVGFSSVIILFSDFLRYIWHSSHILLD